MCNTLKKIKNNTATELLEKYEIPLSPPIDIISLLQKIGISLIKIDFTEIEKEMGLKPNTILGSALSTGNTLAILYKYSNSYEWQRFTIAYELGHCCINSNKEINHIWLNYPSNNYKEIEANIFAEQLLIPYSALKQTYSQLIIPSLSSLTKIFEVPVNTMVSRLNHLNIPYFKDI